MAWDLSQLNLKANDYVITDVSNYYIRSFLCIKSRNDSVKCELKVTGRCDYIFLLSLTSLSSVPTLIETIWPENLLLIPPKIFPSDLSQTKSLTDCNGIIQAVGTAVDSNNLLWVIDSGSTYCRPKLLVFDLKKNEEVCASLHATYLHLVITSILCRFIATNSTYDGTHSLQLK